MGRLWCMGMLEYARNKFKINNILKYYSDAWTCWDAWTRNNLEQIIKLKVYEMHKLRNKLKHIIRYETDLDGWAY